MSKYVLVIPQGGFNDCLSVITFAIEYCRKMNRILLLDMMNSIYKINFNDFFDIDDPNIIYDFDTIKQMCLENNYTVYPNILTNKLLDILNGNIQFTYKDGNFFYNDTELSILRGCNLDEDIIVYSSCGGMEGIELFRQLSFKNNIKDYCKQKLALLKDNNYLCIQVRNTDYKCDYQRLYNDFMEVIHSYDKVYIATDDKLAIDYFKAKHGNVYNFNVFPEEDTYVSLHTSNVNPTMKILCLICDLIIATNSRQLISYSKGGFIDLMYACFLEKDHILSKLL
jgi:hypothetical protein